MYTTLPGIYSPAYIYIRWNMQPCIHYKEYTIHIKLCENTKNYKYAYPGSKKDVYGACEQESEIKKFKILIF